MEFIIAAASGPTRTEARLFMQAAAIYLPKGCEIDYIETSEGQQFFPLDLPVGRVAKITIIGTQSPQLHSRPRISATVTRVN